MGDVLNIAAIFVKDSTYWKLYTLLRKPLLLFWLNGFKIILLMWNIKLKISYVIYFLFQDDNGPSELI